MLDPPNSNTEVNTDGGHAGGDGAAGGDGGGDSKGNSRTERTLSHGYGLPQTKASPLNVIINPPPFAMLATSIPHPSETRIKSMPLD